MSTGRPAHSSTTSEGGSLDGWLAHNGRAPTPLSSSHADPGRTSQDPRFQSQVSHFLAVVRMSDVLCAVMSALCHIRRLHFQAAPSKFSYILECQSYVALHAEGRGIKYTPVFEWAKTNASESPFVIRDISEMNIEKGGGRRGVGGLLFFS